MDYLKEKICISNFILVYLTEVQEILKCIPDKNGNGCFQWCYVYAYKWGHKLRNGRCSFKKKKKASELGDFCCLY